MNSSNTDTVLSECPQIVECDLSDTVEATLYFSIVLSSCSILNLVPCDVRYNSSVEPGYADGTSIIDEQFCDLWYNWVIWRMNKVNFDQT